MDPVTAMLMEAAAGQSGPLSYVGKTNAFSASGTSITVVPHANALPGDLLVAQLGSYANVHFPDKAGWDRYQRASGTWYGSNVILGHYMQPDDVAGVTFVHTESTEKIVSLHVFRNARLEQANHGQIIGAANIEDEITVPGLTGASGGYALRACFGRGAACAFTIASVSNNYLGNKSSLGLFVNAISAGDLPAVTCTATKVTWGVGFCAIPVLIAQG
jgi:hypothetical protein